MPITKLTPGSTYTFTAGSGSTDSISFIGGTETPFNYVFRNGIITGVTNINSASNGAYSIKDLTSLNNQAELHNNGTYRYGFRQIATGSWDVSNNNIDKSKLIQNGSLFVVTGNENTIITLPHTAPNLSGTVVRIVKVNDGSNSLEIKTKAPAENVFKGYTNSTNTLEQAPTLYTTNQYAAIELMSSGSTWIVLSRTGTWQLV
jgi:hypothetical protein